MFDSDLDSNHQQLVVPQRKAACTLSPTSLGWNLEDITIGKTHYEHKAARCGCKDLSVFIDFGDVWTDCRLHGWQNLGAARRIYPQAV